MRISPIGSHPNAAPLERTSNIGRAVVQPGRTLAWGARGREFESRQPDHVVERNGVLSETLDVLGDVAPLQGL